MDHSDEIDDDTARDLRTADLDGYARGLHEGRRIAYLAIARNLKMRMSLIARMAPRDDGSASWRKRLEDHLTLQLRVTSGHLRATAKRHL